MYNNITISFENFQYVPLCLNVSCI